MKRSIPAAPRPLTRAAAVVALALAPWALSSEVQATCTPTSPVNNAEVTCTGTTTDQNGAAGYGSTTDVGNTITVESGASVSGSGTTDGILFNSGTVTNFGSISGFYAINATTATVNNSGAIMGGERGISATTANVTNSGTVTGGGGIIATTANVTNSGTIKGTGAFGYGIGATTANVTNSGTVWSANYGISATTVNLTNSGTIWGNNVGIDGTNVTVSNSGTVTGNTFYGIYAYTSATVTNSGTITGRNYGIITSTANIVNSGAISSANYGVGADTATIINSGTIVGGFIGIEATTTANVTNSGTISGGAAALQFFGNSDTLTLLPGSTIIGAINLGGGGDTVNFNGGNHNLTFDTLTGANVTGTTPFAVSGNRAAAVDPTPFAMSDRNVMDFSRGVSAALPEIDASNAATTAAADTGSALAFGDSGAAPIAGDFAALPGVSAYAGETPVFKSRTVLYRDGTAVWARGFAGQRVQQADGVLLHTTNQFYGGLIGGGWQARPDLRVGVFAGAGEMRSSVDYGYGEAKSTLVFAGLFGRYTWGASFLRAAVQGGFSRNDSTRTINNNLVSGGLETATARFDGWYVSPEVTYGVHYGLGILAGAAYVLIPSLQVRYVHAAFDGYAESGSTANLTVGDRAADNFEERAELKLARTVTFAPTDALTTNLFGGLLADQRAGSTTIDATLLGQAIPFATPGDDSVWGGFGGAGLEWHSRSVTLFASADYIALSDSSSVVGGEGGLRVAF